MLGTGFGFTEGPAWNTPGNYLVFSDIPGDGRWRWSEQGGMELPGPGPSRCRRDHCRS